MKDSQPYIKRRKALKAKSRSFLTLGIVLLHLPFLALLHRCGEVEGEALLRQRRKRAAPVTPQEELPLWTSEEPVKRFWATHLTDSPERVAGPFQPSPYLEFHRWNGWDILGDLKDQELAESGPRSVFRLTIREMSPREPKLPPPRRRGSAAPTFPKVLLPIAAPHVPEPSLSGLFAVSLLVLLARRGRV